MSNNHIAITDRTKKFAIRVVKACCFLDQKAGVCRTLAKQLIRAVTSVGANVREAQFAQSDKDFLSKLEIFLKEARETQYWLEILIESELVEKPKFEPLLQEANEIGSIPFLQKHQTIRNRGYTNKVSLRGLIQACLRRLCLCSPRLPV